MSAPQDYEKRYSELRHMVDRRLASLIRAKSPADLNEACRYVLSAGGKRVRSTLLILSCEAVGGRAVQALEAGAAIEVMHNFTLVHDDIMDNAPSRRGRRTVHIRWNLNTALLVGDVMVGLAYKTLLDTKGDKIREIIDLFSAGLIGVCQGQSLDLAYERRPDVTIPEYFLMIEKKTGLMISMATHLGAVIGDGSASQIEALRLYGRYIGRAFQLRDDLLDVVATRKDFGKSIGGDIVEGKKTFLLLLAAERAKGGDRKVILGLMRRHELTAHPVSATERRKLIMAVTAIYRRYGIIEETREQIRKNTRKAAASLAVLPRVRATGMLQWFSEALMNRIS